MSSQVATSFAPSLVSSLPNVLPAELKVNAETMNFQQLSVALQLFLVVSFLIFGVGHALTVFFFLLLVSATSFNQLLEVYYIWEQEGRAVEDEARARREENERLEQFWGERAK